MFAAVEVSRKREFIALQSVKFYRRMVFEQAKFLLSMI